MRVIMTSIRAVIQRLFTQQKPLPAGTHHYQAPPDAEFPYRLHLRLEADGSGILIVNAATVLHLNQTAAEFAYHLMKGSTNDEAAHSVSQRYRISFQNALDDYKDFNHRINELINTPDLDPETYLGFERVVPYSQSLSAPYRLDCALTYRLAPGSPADLAPTDRVKRELSTDEWKAILDKAWTAGIPHVVFTGGEPTLRDDLPELIAKAEANGQVSGLISDCLRMVDVDYLSTLLQTGLDHLLMMLNPENELAWQALVYLMRADLFVVVHLTLTAANAPQAGEILDKLVKMGVKTLSLSAAGPDLAKDLARTRELATLRGLTLVWDLPVPYSASHPLALELAGEGEKLPEGAGKAWLYVEPDGDVLPAQGVTTVLGNLLADEWSTIWK